MYNKRDVFGNEMISLHYLFDMDGVLVNSSPVTLKAVQQLLAPYGATVKKEDLVPYIGAGEEKLIAGVAAQYGVPYRSTLKAELYEAFGSLAKEYLKALPHAKEVVLALRDRGEKVALSSSADMVKIKINMACAQIPLTAFHAIVSGEDARHKKPNPEIFLKTAEKLGVLPGECLVIEDAINGIQAAKTAGMRVAAITSYFSREKLKEEHPDFIIDDLLEILDLSL